MVGPKVRVYSHWPSSDVLATALHPAGREASIIWGMGRRRRGMISYDDDDDDDDDDDFL